eukprot:Rhum_TRINITY_DN10273_c0_g1::Rhum_TRINITY_DN10273_c0_g1_i1::g.37654::m.37654
MGGGIYVGSEQILVEQVHLRHQLPEARAWCLVLLSKGALAVDKLRQVAEGQAVPLLVELSIFSCGTLADARLRQHLLRVAHAQEDLAQVRLVDQRQQPVVLHDVREALQRQAPVLPPRLPLLRRRLAPLDVRRVRVLDLLPVLLQGILHLLVIVVVVDGRGGTRRVAALALLQLVRLRGGDPLVGDGEQVVHEEKLDDLRPVHVAALPPVLLLRQQHQHVREDLTRDLLHTLVREAAHALLVPLLLRQPAQHVHPQQLRRRQVRVHGDRAACARVAEAAVLRELRELLQRHHGVQRAARRLRVVAVHLADLLRVLRQHRLVPAAAVALLVVAVVRGAHDRRRRRVQRCERRHRRVGTRLRRSGAVDAQRDLLLARQGADHALRLCEVHRELGELLDTILETLDALRVQAVLVDDDLLHVLHLLPQHAAQLVNLRRHQRLHDLHLLLQLLRRLLHIAEATLE